MTKLRWIAAAALLGTAWASPAVAQGTGGEPITPDANDPPSRAGTRGANFLHVGIGARGNAMAGAVGSSIEGPQAWFWNPAGAVSSESFSVAFGRQNLYGSLDVAQHYAGV